MTAKEMFMKALNMLGYIEPTGNYDETLNKKAVGAVNAIYCDLYYLIYDSGFTKLTSLNDHINLPERILNDVMPYGVAMHLSLLEGDSLNEQIFASFYNSKRLTVAERSHITDSFPDTLEV